MSVWIQPVLDILTIIIIRTGISLTGAKQVSAMLFVWLYVMFWSLIVLNFIYWLLFMIVFILFQHLFSKRHLIISISFSANVVVNTLVKLLIRSFSIFQHDRRIEERAREYCIFENFTCLFTFKKQCYFREDFSKYFATHTGAQMRGGVGVSHPPNNFNSRSQLQFDGDKSVPLWACMYRISVYNTLR